MIILAAVTVLLLVAFATPYFRPYFDASPEGWVGSAIGAWLTWWLVYRLAADVNLPYRWVAVPIGALAVGILFSLSARR